ncbi:MAG: VCBS repeat-containing protein [Oscillibacter sp.]|jgi:hypothetical protein|nr:VCBS repeat-containing protein [Oscillibacter sp.]
MENRMKKLWALCLAVLTCLSACGCAFRFAASPDDLYALPQLPAEYTELNDLIQKLIDGGAEYAAPASGTNIQPVQLVDLDGDGQEEALAFLRKSADERPLKIYIFAKTEQSYKQAAVIESSGTAINSVAYNDLDQDGRPELIVGWKVGTELQALTVYTARGREPQELMRTNYVRYAVTDLNGDQHREIVVLHSDDEGSGVADYYTWQKDTALERTSTARISMTMAELSNMGRVKTGTLQGKIPALFVTGVSDSNEEITDVLIARGGELTNPVLSDRTGVSTEIYRFVSLYPTDINGDGITEIPAPRRESLRPGSTGPGQNCLVDWKSYTSAGESKAAESTYHNMDDGWYLVLPDTWSGKIGVARTQPNANETAVTFFTRGDAGSVPQEFLKIYTITGSNRAVNAARGNRFLLVRQAETIYAAELLNQDGTWQSGVTEDSLRGRFNLITSEWTSNDN